MPRKKTADSWGLNNTEYKWEEGEIIKIWCKTCRKSYSDASNKDSPNAKSFIKGQLDAYVDGTNVIKKSNFSDHVIKCLAQRLNIQPANSTKCKKKYYFVCSEGWTLNLTL